MNQKQGQRYGFSLIIIAVIILIFGILFFTFFTPDSTLMLNRVSATKDKLAEIKTAVKLYYSLNSNKYPCPARFDKAPSNANFGIAIDPACDPATTCTPIPNAIICQTIPTKTWIGAVPVRDLGLPDTYAFDEWGNHVTYVVNNNTTFAIKNLDKTTTTANTHFHAVSHGPDGVGAYNRGGTQNPCSKGGIVTPGTYELENCNFTTDDTFIYDKWNSNAATFYDDLSIKY